MSAASIESYSLAESAGDPPTVPAILSYREWESVGGLNAMGNFERSESGDLFLPTWFTRGTDETPHRLMSAKRACVQGTIQYEQYVDQVVASMRGKNGSVRAVNTMTVQGSCRMVISPWHDSNAGHISIPRCVANNIKVLECINGTYTESFAKDGDYAIVVRQPCMWSGGAQPMKISVTEPIMSDSTDTWDVNASMRLPLPLCGPYGGDYDGDEMTMFVLKSESAIAECDEFRWPYQDSSPYKACNNSLVMAPGSSTHTNVANLQAMCTTTCWSDRLRGTRITQCHRDWLCDRAAFISITETHKDPEDFMNTSMMLTRAGFSKSSHQSDVGAIARRSKLGAERLTLDINRMPMLKYMGRPSRHLVDLHTATLRHHGWFGNPCVRAVSKLCASIMQITLKVKSSSSIEVLSPTLSLLEGSESWLVVTTDGAVRTSRQPAKSGYENIQCTCSLMDISHAPVEHKGRLTNNFMNMVLVESNKRMDRAELWCLRTLMACLSNTATDRPVSIQMETHTHYAEFNTLHRFNGCFVDGNNIGSLVHQAVPSSVIEAMLLSKFDDFPSILPR